MGISQDERIQSLMDSNITLRATVERLERERDEALNPNVEALMRLNAKFLARAERAERECDRLISERDREHEIAKSFASAAERAEAKCEGLCPCCYVR